MTRMMILPALLSVCVAVRAGETPSGPESAKIAEIEADIERISEEGYDDNLDLAAWAGKNTNPNLEEELPLPDDEDFAKLLRRVPDRYEKHRIFLLSWMDTTLAINEPDVESFGGKSVPSTTQMLSIMRFLRAHPDVVMYTGDTGKLKGHGVTIGEFFGATLSRLEGTEWYRRVTGPDLGKQLQAQVRRRLVELFGAERAEDIQNDPELAWFGGREGFGVLMLRRRIPELKAKDIYKFPTAPMGRDIPPAPFLKLIPSKYQESPHLLIAWLYQKMGAIAPSMNSKLPLYEKTEIRIDAVAQFVSDNQHTVVAISPTGERITLDDLFRDTNYPGGPELRRYAKWMLNFHGLTFFPPF